LTNIQKTYLSASIGFHILQQQSSQYWGILGSKQSFDNIDVGSDLHGRSDWDDGVRRGKSAVSHQGDDFIWAKKWPVAYP